MSRFLKVFYTELALKEPIIPTWAHPTAPGALCAARLEPDFRLHSQSHGYSDPISVDQLLTPIQTKDGQILEAPRRLLIECPHWVCRNIIALRILHAWSKEPPWPMRGTPVALTIFLPLAEMNNKKSIAHFVEKVRIFLSILFLLLIYFLMKIDLIFTAGTARQRSEQSVCE